MSGVGKQQFRSDSIGEIRLARDQCLQRIAVTVIGHEFGFESLFAIIAALERREYWSHAGSAVDRGTSADGGGNCAASAAAHTATMQRRRATRRMSIFEL